MCPNIRHCNWFLVSLSKSFSVFHINSKGRYYKRQSAPKFQTIYMYLAVLLKIKIKGTRGERQTRNKDKQNSRSHFPILIKFAVLEHFKSDFQPSGELKSPSAKNGCNWNKIMLQKTRLRKTNTTFPLKDEQKINLNMCMHLFVCLQVITLDRES